jgi:septal ring factor EnvC (AmiA/AmiB activator)
MPVKDLIQLIFSILLGVGVFAGGVGYVVSAYMQGKKGQTASVVSSADQLTDFWKDQVDGFKAMVSEQNVKIQNLTNELNQVRGQLNSREKQIEELQATLNLRNPEMKQFMELMMQSVREQSESHTEIVRVLKDLHAMSSSNHLLLQNEQEKELKIEGTVTKK